MRGVRVAPDERYDKDQREQRHETGAIPQDQEHRQHRRDQKQERLKMKRVADQIDLKEDRVGFQPLGRLQRKDALRGVVLAKRHRSLHEIRDEHDTQTNSEEREGTRIDPP